MGRTSGVSSYRIAVDPNDGGLQKRFAKAAKHETVEMVGEVCVGFRVYLIRDINHHTHSFRAAFRVFYDWIDTELAAKLKASPIDLPEDEWEQWIPEVSFTNAEALAPERWQHPPRVCDAATGRVYIHRRYEGTFSERLELQNFPYDQQSLTINLQLSNSRFRAHCLRALPVEFRGLPNIPGLSDSINHIQLAS